MKWFFRFELHQFKEEKSFDTEIENHLSKNDLSNDVKTVVEKNEVMPVVNSTENEFIETVKVEHPTKKRKLNKNIFNKFCQEK